jgi:oxalate decarboxylase/phosphoglucose isomerase-like protein (cupin superfamily)
MTNWGQPTLIPIPTFSNPLGSLGVVEGVGEFPFSIKRVYFLHNVPEGAVRGSHAHKNLSQLIIALSGSLTVTLDDGFAPRVFELESADQGLTVPPGYWRTLTNFSEGCTALVLASEEFKPSDYIRDYDEFLLWVKNK